MSGVRLELVLSVAVWASWERRDGYGASTRRETPVERLVEGFLAPGIVGSVGF
jgi:hypothetical protein